MNIPLADFDSTRYSPLAPHRIVAMIAHNGRLFLATERRCYEYHEGALVPMVFDVACERVREWAGK